MVAFQATRRTIVSAADQPAFTPTTFTDSVAIATRRTAACALRRLISITKENRMDIDTQTELETKAGLPQDAVVTHAEMMRAFEEFKEANDQRIADIERRGADVLTDEKLARIDKTIDAQGRRLDEIALKNVRPALGSGHARATVEHKAAFEAYVRSGESANLRSLESKALSVG